ncbi:hypothetical protein N9S31_01240 [bacterium]|nr:hypothetical protein [bacterium]
MSAALVRHTDATAAWSRAKAYATPEGADASRADAARASVDSREPASSALGRDDDDDDDADDDARRWVGRLDKIDALGEGEMYHHVL